MAEMTALFGGCGPKWQARQVTVPEPGPKQILIRTHAVSVNNADIAMLTDDNTADHQNATCAGYEFAGEVAALGAEVDSFRVGDAVMGTAPHSFAEYVVPDHRHLFPIPEGVSDEDAAALPTGLLTEHGALQLARFEPGQTVLITAASSNIGLIGLQIAKALGAGTVIATSRTADKTDLLAQTGADVVVATDTQDLATAVFDATSHNGVDIVLDHVGGQTLSDCLPTTTVDGHLVSIGRLSQDETTISLSALAGRVNSTCTACPTDSPRPSAPGAQLPRSLGDETRSRPAGRDQWLVYSSPASSVAMHSVALRQVTAVSAVAS